MTIKEMQEQIEALKEILELEEKRAKLEKHIEVPPELRGYVIHVWRPDYHDTHQPMIWSTWSTSDDTQ